MKISELFQRLSTGELSNLSVADDGTGTIQRTAQARMVRYTNEALLRLHSRFVLAERSIILEQVSSFTSYPLKWQYAASNTVSTEPHKFILDSVDKPFRDDVIKILRVEDEVGFVFPLNDDENPISLFTPRPNELQIPSPQNEVVLAVTYQARHPLLRTFLTGSDLLNQEFDIPFTLEGALQNYVAHMVYSHMNGQENLLKSQEYKSNYEEQCLEVQNMDLVNQSMSLTNTRFDARGWV